MRPPWDKYFMDIATLVASRSTCLRRNVGACVVKDRRILTTGYNGAPTGIAHCEDVGCLRKKLKVPSGERHELCRGLHAEQNAIIHAAKTGISLEGATMYVTNHPCFICAKMIINSGIKKVVYKEGYPDKEAEDFFKESGIEVVKLEGYE
ncbi:MAG: cytidine/deoxycytidylate deaminase family protein [candidate division WOR-3 bacterium]|nr:cytidine/deoxycytidylate deaminase family protein [candidate division WOR-3 bacterium]